MTEASAAVLDRGPEADRPLESWMLSTVRWTRGILVVCVVCAVMAAIAGSLVDQNRAAQASWVAQAQLGKQRDDRREELRNALRSLESLHADLKQSVSHAESAAERTSQGQRWQQQLSLLRQLYKLNGPVKRFGGADIRAEESLRAACATLSALHRTLMTGDASGDFAALELSLQRSLEQARADLE